jgi:putative membrane protein
MTVFGLTGAKKFARRHPLRAGLLGWYLVFWATMAISPVDRSDWLLENLLAFIFIGLLVATYRSSPLSDTSYVLITVFMTLHAVGAHYTYSQVPLGYWMQDAFHLTRNHFDRIVHFGFGLLMTYPFHEVLVITARIGGWWVYVVPVNITVAFSGLFEVIESWVARIVSPELGDAYLGTQGDIWDAQKDMSAALAGAVLCMILVVVFERALPRRVRTSSHQSA